MATKAKAGAANVTIEQVAQHKMLLPLLQSMQASFEELSKKKQDGVLSKTKVAMVNRLLTPIHKLLENEPDRGFLDLLDEENLPQNSDVVLILGQTLTALDNFFKSHSRSDGYNRVWNT